MFLCFIRIRRPPRSTRPATLFPDTSRFRAPRGRRDERQGVGKNGARRQGRPAVERGGARTGPDRARRQGRDRRGGDQAAPGAARGSGGAALGPRTIARARGGGGPHHQGRSEEHTSELQSLMRISYDVFCLKKKKKLTNTS